MIKHIDILVKGKVQGVFFRQAAKEKARELGIVGYAENKEDGSVYIEAEGEGETLKEFLNWCKSRPSYAKVDDISSQGSHAIKNFQEFQIR